jgi:hypothetical protein
MIRINPSRVLLKGEDLSEYENVKANDWGNNVNNNKNTKENTNIEKSRKAVINERIGLTNNKRK